MRPGRLPRYFLQKKRVLDLLNAHYPGGTSSNGENHHCILCPGSRTKMKHNLHFLLCIYPNFLGSSSRSKCCKSEELNTRKKRPT